MYLHDPDLGASPAGSDRGSAVISQQSLDRIEQRLKALEGEGGKAKAGSSS
jgi:hypothetical protein